MRLLCLAVILTGIAAGDDSSGVTPRTNASDYAAAQKIDGAELAATLLTPETVRKMFSPETARAYAVVEVAIYPAGGQRFEVNLFDWVLKTGKDTIDAGKPDRVMIPWGTSGGPKIPNRGPTVTEDTTVVVAHGTDPWTGKPRTQVGTYQDVGVSNAPRADAPAPRKPDQTALYERIKARALPEGVTGKPVAGYLYFPLYGRQHKKDQVVLDYAHDRISAGLKLK